MVFNIDTKKAAKTCATLMDYGTSGFRSKAENLDHVLYRTGMLAVLRSKKKEKVIGLMVTASHNPDCDNGVKLIDPNGEMLEHSWESLATTLINAEEGNLKTTLENLVESEKIDLTHGATVYIGYDTRSSSPKLAQLAIEGILALKGHYINYGVVTTPVLHYMVYCKNKNYDSRDEPDQKDYNLKLTNAFRLLNDSIVKGNRYSSDVVVDASNGVGAGKVKELLNDIGDILNMEVYNDGNGVLNYKCGADYVKVNQKTPEGIPLKPRMRCVSLDGDADRLIYFYVDDEGHFHMLDGDRIATLIAGYVMELTRKSNIDISVGLIQTAYANGNSTYYITKKLNVPVACVPTGVKHLHQKAKEFDVGVYFEANGHGTVIYSENAQQKIRATAESKAGDSEAKDAAQRLWNLVNLTNQTVGDAISDLLIVETILKSKDWSMADWEKCYVDLPNRLMKVTIKDRNVIKTTDAERICTHPEGLQEEINKYTSKFSKGRAFVRASGTEDVVRVYSEASTQTEADELGLLVASAVYRMAGGVGDLPRL